MSAAGGKPTTGRVERHEGTAAVLGKPEARSAADSDCQKEAVETIIYLAELRIPGKSSRTGFKNFALSDEGGRRGCSRGKCRLA